MDINLLRTFTTTRRIKTGIWSRFQPVFLNSISPCMEACPLGIDTPKIYWLHKEKGFKEAAFYLLLYNPFPSITGRVCPCFCEERCNRAQFDEAVSIRKIEGFLGDVVLQEGLMPPKEDVKKWRIAIVGSGPSGLSCAWYLALFGFNVVVFERENVAGGVLQWGIPEFRLPKNVVKESIKRVKELGVEIRTGMEITPCYVDTLSREFDRVIIAVGLQSPRMLKIRNAQYALKGLDVLKKYNLQGLLPSGKRVVVVGGGNVAVDVARVFSRNGKDVSLICVEPKDEMPAISEEIEEALAEGVKIVDSMGVKEIIVEDEKIKGVKIGKVKITGERDRFKEVRFIGSDEYIVSCDVVVFAVGQDAEFDFGEGCLIGDYATGPSTVAQAISTGRDVAFMMKAEYEGKTKNAKSIRELLWGRDIKDVVSFEELNLWYFKKTPRQVINSFERLADEMNRCFSCGYCNVCGNCWIFCPDLAISLEEKPVLDPDHCKGCGICAFECPRAVISMKPKF